MSAIYNAEKFYLKVALKRFIDDVSVEVMEAQLVSKLHDILSPVSIFSMPDEIVTRIAGESEESRAEREQLMRQLEVLRAGLETCKRFASVRVAGGVHLSAVLTVEGGELTES